nr:DNA helicase [Tanacetum cinerariifolium]
MEERDYNREELAQLKDESIPLLNVEQRQIYDFIMNADTNSQQELIFLYGHGGTGKTFLWKTIISSPRSEGKIVLAVASLVLLGGNFRQSLPVKKGASKIEVISSCISEFALWPSFKVFALKHNMRLARLDISLVERSLVNSFASWLLDVDDGKIGEPADEDPKNTDRRTHAYTRHLMETEARMSREAWVRATYASDLVHSEVMSLRTTVLGQMSEIRELQAANRRRRTVILELLRRDHMRSTEITELRTALQGQVTALQAQVTTLQGQQRLAGGPTQPGLPEEAGSGS